jgi:hypothetical protein
MCKTRHELSRIYCREDSTKLDAIKVMCLFTSSLRPSLHPSASKPRSTRSFGSLDLDSERPMAPAISLPSRRSLLASFTTCFHCCSPCPGHSGTEFCFGSFRSTQRYLRNRVSRWVCLCLRSVILQVSGLVFRKDLRVNDGLCPAMIYALSLGLISAHRRFHG